MNAGMLLTQIAVVGMGVLGILLERRVDRLCDELDELRRRVSGDD